MEGWTTFWGWILIVVLLAFTLVATVVTIGGFSDIKALLKSLDRTVSPDEPSGDE